MIHLRPASCLHLFGRSGHFGATHFRPASLAARLSTSASSKDSGRSKTFDNQSLVPRLPIPTLLETSAKYLSSLKPLLSAEAYDHSKAIVEDFIRPGGLGEKLQARLKAHDLTQDNSWLERIWLEKAYLDWPDPIMINVNWWLQFKDLDSARSLIDSPPPRGEFSQLQVSRAAGIVAGLLDFKVMLDREELPPQFMGKAKVPLCMNQFRQLFGVTRVPGKVRDSIRQEFPCTSRHIVVHLDDQIYKLDVVSQDGIPFAVDQIERLIQASVDLHLSTPVEERQASIGVLTSDNRREWAKARSHLMDMNADNKQSLEIVESALFSVCLESYSTSSDLDTSHRVIFHGHNGRNRWFDKSLSFILMSNSRAGCNGEHSPSDAVIPGQVMEYIAKQEPITKSTYGKSVASLPEPQLVKWTSDEAIDEAIAKAESRAESDIEDLDSVLLHFNDYGGGKIKASAKCSPDAFVQMAMQLAYYRTYREPCATYESAAVRQFLHGRTETIRSCSVESVAFTRAFDSDVAVERKVELLKNACDAHLKYAVAASNAKGCDRHLLGLRTMLEKGEEKSAKLFQDPAFMQSMHFKLSTSNVSPGDYYYGGFGPVYPDGYGINYAIGAEGLKFSISSRRKATSTCSTSFRKILEGSLVDLMKACEQV